MIKVIKEEDSLPIKLWLEDIEDEALEQARHLARLPFAHKWICLMPDAHMGYGMPIGGVLATKGIVIPNAVGVDIGCGMCFQATNIPIEILYKETGAVGKLINGIIGSIKRNIPTGFAKHQTRQVCSSIEASRGDVVTTALSRDNKPGSGLEILENAQFQIGTLGGGNHFIELQADKEDHLCIMLHSGSRNLGKRVCEFYNNVANKLNAEWFSAIDPKWGLGFLPMNSRPGKEYLAWMDFALRFAMENRQKMMHQCLSVVCNMIKKYDGFSDLLIEDQINIHHNYAAMENHFGENLMIHRKGATKATTSTVGIIPGSQGTSSYIVQGLGNPDSFMSCSHGAGRRMGRKEATRTLVLADEQAKMKDIVHGMTQKEDLEEAPGAYKEIDLVLAQQADLVKIIKKLRPIASIKG